MRTWVRLSDLTATVVGGRRLGPLGFATVAAILMFDAALVGANLVYITVDEPSREPTHPIFSDRMWDGDFDNGWMERAGQLQLVGALGGLLVLQRRHGDALYVVLAVLIACLVIDDAGQLHEAGGALAGDLGVPAILGVPPAELGELAVWAIGGAVLLTGVGLAYAGAAPLARTHGRLVLAAVTVLAVFAIVLDVVKSAIEPMISMWVISGLRLAENVGELVSSSLILIVVLVLLAAAPDPTAAGDDVTQPLPRA